MKTQLEKECPYIKTTKSFVISLSVLIGLVTIYGTIVSI